jgi:hypothetical protein
MAQRDVEDNKQSKDIRRGQVNYESYVDAVVAGRQKKVSVVVPSAPISRTNHPKRILLSEADYDHLLAEVVGINYGSGDRPELEVVVIMRNDNEERKDMKEPSCERIGDLETEVDELNMKQELEKAADGTTQYELLKESMMKVTLLYDSARILFIYSQTTEYSLLQLLSTSQQHELRIDAWYSQLQHRLYHCMDSQRLRTWRRFLRFYVLPIFSDRARMAQCELEMRLLRQRQASDAKDYSDTDSSSCATRASFPERTLVLAALEEEAAAEVLAKGVVAVVQPSAPTSKKMVKGTSRGMFRRAAGAKP